MEKSSPDPKRTLADLSVVELKAICYDQLAKINQCNEIVKAIELEITRKNSLPVPPTKKEEEPTGEAKEEKCEPTEKEEYPMEEEKK